MSRSRRMLAFALVTCLFAPAMAFGQRNLEGNGPKPWNSGNSPFASHTPKSTFSQSHHSKKPEKAVSNRDSQPERSQSNGEGQNNSNGSRRAEDPRGGKGSEFMKQKLDRNNDGRVGPRELEHAKQVKENASKRKEGQANPPGAPPRLSGEGGRPKQTATKKAPKVGRGA